MNNTIINTAFTGAVSDKSRNTNVPISIPDIVADAVLCTGLGTSMGHFHVRNDDGSPSCDPKLYGQLFEKLREDARTRQLVLVASTSGRHGQTLADRSAVLQLAEDIRPDMASLTLSSMNFATGESINRPDDIRALAEKMQEYGVKPELEIFDLGMITFARKLIDEGIITPPYFFNIILGNVAGAGTDLATLAALLANLPAGSVVSLGGIGRAQLSAHLLAMSSADGVRTGLEDNLWMSRNREPASNALLVQRVSDLSQLSGRSLASTATVRQQLDLRSGW